MCRREEAHRLPKPSTAFQSKPTAELAPAPTLERRDTDWHAVAEGNNRCASRTQRIRRLDRGSGLEWGITAPDSHVTGWSLANHIVRPLGGEDVIVAFVGCADARRRIGCSNQAPPFSPNPPRNWVRGPGVEVHGLPRRTGGEQPMRFADSAHPTNPCPACPGSAPIDRISWLC